MNQTSKNIDELLIRILDDTATRADVRMFAEWIRAEENRKYFEQYKKIWHTTTGVQCDDQVVEEGWQDYKQFMRALPERRKRAVVLRKVLQYAAIVAVILSCVYFFLKPTGNMDDQAIAYVDITIPNERGVMLTLADGEKVVVGNEKREVIFEKTGNVNIKQEGRNELVYENVKISEKRNVEEEAMNEITVPAGERVSIILSDGTKVWLNSESAIRYPVRFGIGKRVVTVKGNVYFEVTKDVSRPFFVVMKDMETEVLGTSFEVNTYGDHGEIYMALVEGCVRVRSGNHVVVAKPNEQVALDLESRKISTKEVDAARLVAWKDGVLMIKNEPFVDVIRRLERWFGVEIENQCLQSSALLFSGVFERSGLEVVLQTICANLNINYVIDGNRVILKN